MRTEDLRCRFCIGLGNVAAVEDIDKFLTACGDLIRHLREKLGDVAAGAEKRAADEAEIVALVDLKAVKIGIAGGVGDLHGGDGIETVVHGGDVVLQIHRRVEIQHGGDALRNGLAGDDNDLLIRQGSGLLGGHDDVLVVGQDEHDLRRSALDGLEDVVGGRVHGLTALNDLVNAEVTENARETGACADGNGAVLLGRSGASCLLMAAGLQLLLDGFEIVGRACGAARRQIVMLHTHVLDLGKLKRAVFLGFVQRLPWNVRMDMDLERLVVLADDETVADGIEVQAQRFDGDVRIFADDVNGVVCKRDVFAVEAGEVRLIVCLGCAVIDNVVALKDGKHPLEDHAEAHAARVHHARLLENGVLVDGVVERGMRRIDALGKDGLNAVVLACKVACGGRCEAGDGENGALGGLHDRFIGGLDACGKRGCKIVAVGLAFALPGRGEAAEQERENDAGVAARAAQHGGRRHIGGLCERGLRVFLKISRGRAERHAHVRAGVAVGDGENVQLVDLLFVEVDRRGRADDHTAEQCAVNFLYQGIHLRVRRDGAALSGNRIHKDIDGPNLGAGGLCHKISHLTDDRVADGADVHALINDDVQINGNGIAVVEGHTNALAHRLLAKQMYQPVRHGTECHALDAEAVRRRIARDAGINVAVDRDGALVRIQTNHWRTPFQFVKQPDS